MQAGVVDWLADDIRRVLAPNPSPMTGPGTNSYILGRGRGVVVVDPGPQDAAHMAALQAALGADETVSAIVVTHAHRDHSTAAPTLATWTGAPVLAFGDATAGRSALMQRLAADGLKGGGEGVDVGFRPDGLLADGQTLPCGPDGLRVIHTPGHMGGHLCLGFGDVLLSGDHAMGWASSLISPPDGDMRAYLASLDRLLGQPWRLMLPGHGAAVVEATSRLRTLKSHRLQREAEVLEALRAGPADPAALTAAIYRDTPSALFPAARRNVLAHLIDLWERNIVTCLDHPRPDTVFTLQKSA